MLIHGPSAHRHGQFDAVQLVPMTFAIQERAQLVRSVMEADTRRRRMARIERVRLVARIVDGDLGGISQSECARRNAVCLRSKVGYTQN